MRRRGLLLFEIELRVIKSSWLIEAINWAATYDVLLAGSLIDWKYYNSRRFFEYSVQFVSICENRVIANCTVV